MQENATIKGYVEDIIFHNDENGYSVFTMEQESSIITAVGCVHSIRPGEYLEMTGEWTVHKRYGKQFSIQKVDRSMPDRDDALVKYLASGFVKGVGLATAQRIVDEFGQDTVNILEENADELAKIKGISLAKARMIGEAVQSRKSLANTILYFSRFGLSPEKGARAYKYLGDDAVEKIKANPYILISDEFGLSFKQADKIALNENEDGDFFESEARIYSGIRYVLGKAAQSGHTYLPKPLFTEACTKVLGVRGELIEDEADSMVDAGFLKLRDGNIYLAKMYEAEKEVAEKLLRLASVDFGFGAKYDYALTESLKDLHMELDGIQTEACVAAIGSGVSVISGGPGTGKTTIIKAIIGVFERTDKKCRLAAPTGRAAKKMEQSSGMEAKTIHRLLEIDYAGEDGIMTFTRDENNPLEADALIIDEMSMVDIELMNSLLKAVTVGTRLVLIGDVDQLPAVGPGDVLRNIIESKAIRSTILKTIYRQETGNMIPVIAGCVNKGEVPPTDVKDDSFELIRCRNINNIVEEMKKIIRRETAAGNDIQVITPGKKGAAGTINLNRIMQEAFNPASRDKCEKRYMNRVFREGDKVMQTRNNYEITYYVNGNEGRGVYNGDIGVLTGINDDSSTMEVLFDDEKSVIYDFEDAEQLETAYAITVHKSQGSEYKTVLMPLYGTSGFLCTRNLLYTAVSRAVNRLYIIGDSRIFLSMIENTNKKPRYSGLKEFLIV